MTKRLFFTAIIFLIPSFVLADGGIFPPPDYYMYETDQRAVIFYENGIETLILSTTFEGDAKNFGWVVPTPSKPEVSKSSDELFTSLDELTRAELNYPRPFVPDEALRVGEQANNVYVIETQKVEYYDIAVLTADNPDVLADWLNENNYQFPTSSAYILDGYVNNGWYFTAIKIDTESIAPEVSRQLRQGHMIPLKLKFSTDKIVYPLKISSITQDFSPSNYYPFKEGNEMPPNFRQPSPDYYPTPDYYPRKTGVLIYVFTPADKQTIPGFNTQYAGWIKKETIEKLAFDDNGDAWLKPSQDKYFLTKLTRWMSYAEMTHDLYLRNASDNNLVNARSLEKPSKIWFWLIMGFSLFFLLTLGIIFVFLFRS